jgi:hypothetical protein
MSGLANRLLRKADMIALGEKIAWGSDSDVMREAAARIVTLETALRSVLASVIKGAIDHDGEWEAVKGGAMDEARRAMGESGHE